MPNPFSDQAHWICHHRSLQELLAQVPPAAGKGSAPPPFSLCLQEVPLPEEATALGLIGVN